MTHRHGSMDAVASSTIARTSERTGGVPASARRNADAAFTARAVAVNRAHRVVRGKALELHSRKSRLRSLYVPLGVSAAFVVILCTAVWVLLSQYEASASNIPDSSSQMLVMVLWFLPGCAAILALVYLHRGGRELTR